MTRITQNHYKNTQSVLIDIFQMYNSREPDSVEMQSLLTELGTHGSHSRKSVIYEYEQMQHIHTKKVISGSYRT